VKQVRENAAVLEKGPLSGQEMERIEELLR